MAFVLAVQARETLEQVAWRIAGEFWLQSKGCIKVHIPPKVLPYFPLFLSHELVACTWAVNEDRPDKAASLWALGPYILNDVHRPNDSNPPKRDVMPRYGAFW